jgi:acyl dehydratase
MEAKDLLLSDIAVGDTAMCSRTWEAGDVARFAELSGDGNPLHMSEVYAETTRFSQRLVHGMLVGSLCSQVLGMQLPGKRCLYLQQNLTFKQPIFIGETTTLTATVLSKSESTQILSIGIVIKKNDSIVIIGEALVQVLS